MVANVEVVNKVINHYIRTFREEVRVTKRTSIETELRIFFTRYYPGSSITRTEAITNAKDSLGLDLARFDDVQPGTVVLKISDIQFSRLGKYTQYRLDSIGRDEDNAFGVVNGVENRYPSHLDKGEYIPLEMFEIIKRKLENSIAEYFPELVISARDLLVDALKDAVTIRRSKIQSLLFRAANSLQLDRSHEDYTSLNYISDFDQVEREIVAEELDKRGHKVELKGVKKGVKYIGVWKDKKDVNRVINLYFRPDLNGDLRPNVSDNNIDKIDIYTRDEYKRIKKEAKIREAVLASQDELVRRLPQIITKEAEELAKEE